MSVLTSDSYVTPMLPTGYAAALVAQGTTLAAQIAIASGIAEGDLEAFYYDLPQASGTPPTQVYVQRFVGILAAHLCHQILGRANEIPDDENALARGYLAQYRDTIKRLTGIDQPDGQATAVIPRIKIVDEEMTFGTSPLGADQYAFAPGVPGGFEVIPGSVRVAGYELDSDFRVIFSAENRGWLLERLTSEIVDTDEVSYDISFLRKREADRPDIVTFGKVVRA